MRRCFAFSVLIAVALAAAACSPGAFGPGGEQEERGRSNAVGSVQDGGAYTLVARSSGMALDVPLLSCADGAAIMQWPANGGANQTFVFRAVGDGYYSIRPAHCGDTMALDVWLASDADGAPIKLHQVHTGYNQQWQVVAADAGHVAIVSRASGRALDVWLDSRAAGAEIRQFRPTGGQNQQWRLVPAGSTILGDAVKLRVLSGIERVFNNLSHAKAVYDPERQTSDLWDSTHAFRLDPAPFRSRSRMSDFFFINNRCTVADLGFGLHLSEATVSARLFGADTSCQMLFRDPYHVSHTSPALHLWDNASRAVWSGHQVGQTVYLVSMTENKSVRAEDGTMRRGPPGWHGTHGYVSFDLQYGARVNPSDTSGSNGLLDGFYMAFITLGRVPAAGGSLAEDLGPIVWPHLGYRRWNGDKQAAGLCSASDGNGCWQSSSLGYRHPRGFVHNGYLYVYFIGNSDWWDKEYSGVFVARAPLSSSLAAEAFRCGHDFSTTCLPAGFDKNDFVSALALRGPAVRPIIAAQEPFSFAVAKLKGQERFVGVLAMQPYHGEGKVIIYLSKGSSLVDWVEVGQVKEAAYSSWSYQNSPMLYPSLLSVDGVSDEVDAGAFFVVGTSWGTPLSPDGEVCPDWPCRITRVKLGLYSDTP